MTDTKTAQSWISTDGRIYIQCTFNDALDATCTLSIGDRAFNTSDGKRVYAAVRNWGSLRKYMPVDGRPRNGEVELEVALKATVVPSQKTAQYTLLDFLRRNAFQNIVFDFYQSNPDSADADYKIWSGYWKGIRSVRDDHGVMVATVAISSINEVNQTKISDVITTSAFPAAPKDSIDKMVSRIWGKYSTKVFDTCEIDPVNVHLGFPPRMIPGVVVDDQLASKQIKIRFAKHSGAKDVLISDNNASYQVLSCGTTNLSPTVTSAALFGSVNVGDYVRGTNIPADTYVVAKASSSSLTIGDSGGANKNATGTGTVNLTFQSPKSFYAYSPQENTYIELDNQDYSFTNDTSVMEMTTSIQPRGWLSLRPVGIGSRMDSTLAADAYKVMDEDPTNYIETTSTHNVIAFNIPPIPLSGFAPEYLKIVVYCENVSAGNRDIQFGIWNEANVGAASWLGNASKRQTKTLAAGEKWKIITTDANRYVADDFKGAGMVSAHSTQAEFNSGRFIGSATGDVATPLQVYFGTDASASKDGVRLYAIGVMVYGKLPAEVTQRIQYTDKMVKWVDVQGHYLGETRELQASDPISEAVAPARGLTFLACGIFEDSGSLAPFRKAPDIAKRIINTIAGKAVNTTSGSLGNFTDAASSFDDNAAEKEIDPSFGPDTQFDVQDSIKVIQMSHPVRIFEDEGVYQCIYDEMNPHSSRLYRSSSDIVRISAKQHVVRGSLQVSEPDFDTFRNSAIVDYGHRYGTNLPAKSYKYDHPLSQTLFSTRTLDPIDAPWLNSDDLTVDSEAAKFLARFLGRRIARPRLTVRCKLTEAMYDLKRGHVVEFDVDMEDVGYICPAFRCGYLDYHYSRDDTAVTNGAMSTGPTLIPGTSGITNQAYFGVQQQLDGLNFIVAAAVGYTTVANSWQYYDGAAWNNLAGTTCVRNGVSVSADGAFTAVGTVSVGWTRPTPTSVKKAEIQIPTGGTVRGPSYWYRHKYITNANGANSGTGPVAYPARWYGRLFEVDEVTRKPGENGEYPYVDAVLIEVM